ncbi:MAG: YkvA family protein [Cyanobacteriota bacterium]|nr:YkvA family protein [Cyanobacteriota bacterium]
MNNISIKSLYEWYRNALRNPKYRWWVVLGTLAYLISPIDLAPDFIPIAGQIDDVMVLTLLLSEVTQMILEFAKRRQGDSQETIDLNKEDTVEVNAVSVEEVG